MTDVSALDRLAATAGIEPGYHDIWGTHHAPCPAAKRAALAAMGIPAETSEQAESGLRQIEEQCWRRSLEPVLVVRETALPAAIAVTLPAEGDERIAWVLEQEDGSVHLGEARRAELQLIGTQEIDGREMRRYRLELPIHPPRGYHTFRLEGHNSGLSLVVAPERCHIPSAVDNRRVWGVSTQLYTVRSRQNWGIGDFGDLIRLARIAGKANASAVGLNPLHALFPDNPEHASPYSPCSRLFLNPLYIDIEAVPEFAKCDKVRDLVASDSFKQGLEASRQAALVDYTAVAARKFAVLEELHRCFRTRPTRVKNFKKFQQEQGEALRRFSLFHTLRENFKGTTWRVWPEAYQDPNSAEVVAFAAAHAERMEFHQYLQFLADAQLEASAKSCSDSGLAIGLYRDLAVSADPNGADAWGDRAVLVADASIGCPPDDFSPQGQDWGAPPLNPLTLRERAYAPFVTLLRANMRHAGALRLDHAMALMHLFWIPRSIPASDGIYVTYPLEDLLGILALESQRQQCLIVGEDLGTVPDGFRERLWAAGIFSYKVFYFERGNDGGFKRPEDYPAQALVTATTHDLPTLRGWWHARDVELRKELAMMGDNQDAYRRDAESRDADRTRLVDSLRNQGHEVTDDWGLFHAVHRSLSSTPTQLLMVQVEDMLGEMEPVNLPGTTDAYPNWRRRLSRDMEDWSKDKTLRTLSEDLAERKGA